MMSTLRCLAATALVGTAAAITVHQIADGECRQFDMERMELVLAREVIDGLVKGPCQSVGYTVEVGSTQMEVPIDGMDVGALEASVFALEGSTVCSHDQMHRLTTACAGFESLAALGICGSDCESAAREMVANDADCIVPGDIRGMLDRVTSGCDGLIDVGVIDVGSASLVVGEHDRCAIGFCEDLGNCPQCAAGLECVAMGDLMCAGTCFGVCVAPQAEHCSTCDQLGWIANSCGEGGACGIGDVGETDPTVCGESDASGLSCTNEVSQARASELCIGVGARLCTASELYDSYIS